MEKESEKIEHSRYQQKIQGQDDRNRLTERIPLHEAFLIDLGFTEQKARKLLREQTRKTNIKNARIRLAEKKEKAKELSTQIDAIKEELPRYMEFYIPDQDEPDIWFSVEPDEKIIWEVRNKIGEVVDTISVAPMEVLSVSFFAALLSLPSPLTDGKKFREALHGKYDEYVVNQFFPQDMNKPQHRFKIKLVWRI